MRLVVTEVEPLAREKLHSPARTPSRVVPVKRRSPSGTETPVETLYSLPRQLRLVLPPPSMRSLKEATRVEKRCCPPPGALTVLSRQRTARLPAAPMVAVFLTRKSQPCSV